MKLLSTVNKIMMVVLVLPLFAFGQATLKGTITDAANNESLIGVNIVVVGTSLGAATDIEGQFRIVSIPERVLNVKISCIGYELQVKEVDFSKTKDVILNIQLKPSVIQGEEVVVTAQMRGQIAAINQQVTSNTIMNVVSEEKIKELPDANAAEAIGRLPGVAIQRNGGEASQIVLRGLSSKYSSITVDGVKIPATDPNTRDVDLSTISQGALAGIELYKTLLPDMDADAIAGAVNLVTRKAPLDRLVRFDMTGDYNNLMKSANQYDFQGRYGERFLDDKLGIQLQGNIEKRIRSKENTAMNWQQQKSTAFASDSLRGKYSVYNDYVSPGYGTATFTDETRDRKGIQAILDYNTPDSGSVKLSGLYSGTGRDIATHSRVYVGTSSSAYWDYNYEYNELRISTVNTSLQGKNYLLGLDIDWCASYAKSITDNPYDFALKFTGGGATNPNLGYTLESLAARADNNFSAAQCSTGVYKQQLNFDQDRTAYLNILKKYTINNTMSGAVKAGGKYREKTRWMTADEYDDNNYLGGYLYHSGIDTAALKNSRFSSYFNSSVPSLLTEYIDAPAASRELLGKFTFEPLINLDALRLWYSLFKDANNSGNREFVYSQVGRLKDYTVVERVSSTYLMNTLNFGQLVTLIAGVRVEIEHNDYTAKYCTGSLGTIGIAVTASKPILDSVATFSQTNWLPNLQFTIKPTSYLNIRIAAYKAIARPDYNLRLPQYSDIGQSGGIAQVTSGNINLKNMEAWNFEVNTQVYDNTIGLVSLSAFYKRITDYINVTNNINLEPGIFKQLCTQYIMAFTNQAIITDFSGSNGVRANIPYNDPDPSYVWGLELEHQMSLGFLHGFLKNFVLSYNVSITRSLTHIIYGVTDVAIKKDSTVNRITHVVTYSFSPVYTRNYKVITRESEGQPNLYGNAALGYDIGGFSGRLSVFYQDKYVRQYTAYDQANIIQDPFFKMDLSLKQQITNSIAIILNINNLTNRSETRTEENTYTNLGIQSWSNPSAEELYGRTIDLGIRISL